MQFIRYLLGLLIAKVCPDCSVMDDYLNWLDNIATGDKSAASYIMKKTDSLGGWGKWTWTGQKKYDFPNFNNQFEGV